MPDGFALVARLEQIFPDGTPKDPPDRWSTRVRPMTRFSLTEYFRALFTATPGHYRIVVFIVSPHPFTQENVAVSLAEGQAWLSGGLNALPPALGARPLTPTHRCTALIYAFEQPAGDAAPVFQDPSPLTGRTHLEKARLWNALAQ
ncbi:MAG: hypothetical protein KatS3mg043_1025 [Rhodothermaceae bacterium]|nr:MAG: hypothetical protein KatS3mg043_1025 [Rhodothermaceae bacterium]